MKLIKKLHRHCIELEGVVVVTFYFSRFKNYQAHNKQGRKQEK